jgi:ribosome recycling factor
LEENLGLTPKVTGTNLKIPVPAMTQERRKELIKQLKNEAEQAKVAVRNIRRDFLALLKDEQKNKAITEDDERKNSELVQKITDKNVNRIDEMIKSKETEILEI